MECGNLHKCAAISWSALHAVEGEMRMIGDDVKKNFTFETERLQDNSIHLIVNYKSELLWQLSIVFAELFFEIFIHQDEKKVWNVSIAKSFSFFILTFLSFLFNLKLKFFNTCFSNAWNFSMWSFCTIMNSWL